MKKLIRLSIALCISILCSTLNGCKKEGPPGPAGSANVTTANFEVYNWSWSGSYYYYADLNVPELNSDNLQSAAVMVYFSTNGGNAWIAVPYTQYESPYNYYMGFATFTNTVQVTWFYDSSLSAGDDPNQHYGVNVKYKVVVIPPSQRLANPDLDLTNYEQVKARFSLED